MYIFFCNTELRRHLKILCFNDKIPDLQYFMEQFEIKQLIFNFCFQIFIKDIFKS